ncbi:collagen-like protein [Zobellia russellii]|nr:collagen-like protein [Zobellia russellii]
MGIAFTSCEGPEGPEGEMGLTGETGAQGEAGAEGEQGVQGEPGEDGNANVIASDWIPSTFSDTETYFQSQEVFDESITGDIIDGAQILTYGRLGNDGDPNRLAFSLPYHYITGEGLYFSYAQIGSIFFSARRTGSDNVIFDYFTAFRYVIIPASSASKANRSNFEKMSYEEVMDHFGLDYKNKKIKN